MAYITSSSQSCSLASWPHLNPKGRKTAIAAYWGKLAIITVLKQLAWEYSKAYCFWLRI